MGRGSYDDPPWGIRVCVLCHGTGHDDPNVELWDRKGNVQHNAVERFGEARAQMKRIEQEHAAKSEFQREVEKLGQRECRHCGWLCMPNDAPAKTFYPLEPQAAQQQAEPSHADSFASKAVYAAAIADAQQAEPSADERAAWDAFLASESYPGQWREGRAFSAGYRAAQSGQRAGVAEDARDAARYRKLRAQCGKSAHRERHLAVILCDWAKNLGPATVNVWAQEEVDAERLDRLLDAAPTQQQEGGDA